MERPNAPSAQPNLTGLLQRLIERTPLLRKGRWYVSGTLLIMALAISASGILGRIDVLLFDVGHHLNRPKVSADIVIIGIDESSLSALGQWPWPRQVHAQLLSVLCQARPKVIGVDIAFTEPGKDMAGDTALASAIERCGNVVLPIVVEKSTAHDQPVLSFPTPSIADKASALGRVGVELGVDGMARSIILKTAATSTLPPLFSQAILKQTGTPDTHMLSEVDGERLFAFVGPTGSIPHVSYLDVLQGNIDAAALTGKLVLIGATAVGLGDFLPTPVSGRDHPMPGVEIQANIVQALQSNRLIEPMSPIVIVTVNLLLALAPMLWLPRLMPLSGLLASAAWIGFLFLLAGLHPHVLHVWLPLSGALAAAFSAFPLWSWRRLEVTRKHLRREYEHLRQSLSGSEEKVSPHQGRLGFEQKIAWIQAAQSRMQVLESQRNEALAFISHDMRTPLASALLALQQESGEKRAPLIRQLQRAHDLAQTFLSLSRAEMMDTTQMKELDLVAVVYQAIDQTFLLAQSKNITLKCELPDDPVWMIGDFSLLERSIMNLLHNAVMLSPLGSSIEVGLSESSEGIEFWVSDEGPGMDETQIAGLFRRFGSTVAAARNDSTGLGLYLVRTVVEKHKGEVHVSSAPGQGARFSMKFKPAPAALATV